MIQLAYNILSYERQAPGKKKQMSGLERARRRVGLSRADVARFTVRTPQSVARWESGRCQVPKGVMLQLASLYRCSPEALVD